MRSIHWTPEMDSMLLRLREQGYAWRRIGPLLGVGHGAARERARTLGTSTGHINSGPMSGVAVATGQRPLPKRFRYPSERKRLGRRWLEDAE